MQFLTVIILLFIWSLSGLFTNRFCRRVNYDIKAESYDSVACMSFIVPPIMFIVGLIIYTFGDRRDGKD